MSGAGCRGGPQSRRCNWPARLSPEYRRVDRRARKTLGRADRDEVEPARHRRRHAHSGRGRRDRGAELRLRVGELVRRERARNAGDWVGLHHGGCRYDGGSAAIDEVLDDDVSVIDDVGLIDRLVHVLHGGCIDAPDIVQIGAIRWVIGLPRAERHPAHGTPAEARSVVEAAACGEPGRGAQGSPADEADQGRRVDRSAVAAAGFRIAARGNGDPAPTAIDLRPTAVVERREPPRALVHPGPAPIADIGPTPLAVGDPVRLHGWIPDGAVLRSLGPGPGSLQVLAAGHAGYDRRDGDGGAGRRAVLGEHGGQERTLRDRAHAALECIRAGDGGGLVRADLEGDVGTRDLGSAIDHGDERRVRRVAGYDVITAVRGNLNGAARRLDGVGGAGWNSPQFQKGFALRFGGDE